MWKCRPFCISSSVLTTIAERRQYSLLDWHIAFVVIDIVCPLVPFPDRPVLGQPLTKLLQCLSFSRPHLAGGVRARAGPRRGRGRCAGSRRSHGGLHGNHDVTVLATPTMTSGLLTSVAQAEGSVIGDVTGRGTKRARWNRKLRIRCVLNGSTVDKCGI